MQVDVIGGGPGGAYVSLLLKKAHPDWRVTVYERYPPATTYGWAIVLPEKTFGLLRAADEPTCERIEEVTVRWDPIDTVHRSKRIRCGGHPYASVMRNELLEILQSRCREVGVEFRFETEADPEDRAAEADLLVGADGLGSQTREAFSSAFEPTLKERSDRYAWFGTDQPFEALTHIYEETEDGVWHGAAYPARTTSTFAIAVDEGTWRRAGIDDRGEPETIAYLEDVFADHLGGHGLLSKEDQWRRFLTVETERWYNDNVVLLGDAAHTAHYTIGSGTRMAVEDAIVLAECLGGSPGGDWEAAFKRYQSRRKPHVEALQAAADLSVTHFENLPRYVHLDPEALAFLYLTRTGSNSYEDLQSRDPTFTDRIDRWFAERAGGDPSHDPAGQPITISEVTVPNRMVSTLQCLQQAEDGLPPSLYRDGAEATADRGAGLVFAEPLAVSADGRQTPGSPGLYADAHVDSLADAIHSIHEAGAVAGGLLSHAGRRGAAQATRMNRPLPAGEAWELLAPSAVAYDEHWPTPRPMDRDDRQRITDAFVQAAERADTAGFDLLAVDLADGHLLGSFLSPLSNRRTDDFGGSLENRLAYPLSVVQAVREVWPAERPLAVKLTATDWADGGTDLAAAVDAARALQRAGCDLLVVSAGGTVPTETPESELARTRRYSHWIRNEVGLPTVSTAYQTTRDQVNTTVAGCRADLCYVYPGATGEE